MSDIKYNPKAYQLITAEQAAQIFGMETLAVTRWARNGTIPYTKLPNGRLRFSRDWCVAYMNQHHEIDKMAKEES